MNECHLDQFLRFFLSLLSRSVRTFVAADNMILDELQGHGSKMNFRLNL